jgi:hypothetical protein
MADNPQRDRISPRHCATGLTRAGFERALLRSLVAALVLTGLGTVGFGEDESSPSIRKPRQAPIRVSSQRSPVPSAGRIIQTGGRRDDPENPPRKATLYDNEPPATTDEDQIPAYPHDPVWPNWTPANDPSKQPVFAPASQYDLVTPPPGIFDTLEDREYQRVVGSEEDLFYDCATCPPPIDLMRPDGIAPAGVFGDHTLNTGGRVLVSYRFNNTNYDGLMSGPHSVSTSSVFNRFALAPTHATFQTHYFLFEFGPTDDFTLQFILPWVERRMTFVGQQGQQLATNITDPYDLQFNTMYVLWRGDRQQLHLNLGMRTPNGIFDQQGQVPTPNSPVLTYPMRTSDGTWDILPGLTYRGQSDYWTWGAQTLFTKRFGKNRYDYRLGDEANLNGWISRKLTDSLSASVRLNGQLWGNITGADHRLNTALVPTNRTDLFGGQRLNILFGLNYIVPTGFLEGQRFSVEGGIPVYQNLSGPQLQQRYDIWASWNFIF